MAVEFEVEELLVAELKPAPNENTELGLDAGGPVVVVEAPNVNGLGVSVVDAASLNRKTRNTK